MYKKGESISKFKNRGTIKIQKTTLFQSYDGIQTTPILKGTKTIKVVITKITMLFGKHYRM